jgi:predicted flap endonuclease-1-like 5' DNA nuclease
MESTTTVAIGHEPGATGGEQRDHDLPISKLRGLVARIRSALKRQRINTCGQLLRAAADAEHRARLARDASLDPGVLLTLVQRADMTRVNGIGAVFGLMLEELGIKEVAALAAQDPHKLHARLRRYNEEEGIARRSPTPEEVADWVEQAKALPVLISY